MSFRLSCLLVAGLLFVSGCGGPPSISGTVTYEGELVGNGVITFAPVDGAGTPASTKIKDGKYHIAEAKEGSMKVSISGYEFPEVPPGSTEPVYTKETVPYNAVGNMQTVEVKRGSQTLDFDLKAPE